jgi:hypothetical protein
MANLLGQNIGTNYKGILNLNTLNGNLSGTLQAVTDGDGNASPLQLSTTQVLLGTTSGGLPQTVNIGETQKLGSGLYSGTYVIYGDFMELRGNSGIQIPTSNLLVGTTSASARLHVRGDGTNPIARFESNDGSINWRFSAGGFSLENSYQAGIFGAAISGDYSFAAGSYNTLAGTGAFQGIANIGGTIAVPSSGTGTKHILAVNYTINNAGAQTGTATGILLNATETALNGMGHNLLDLQVGGVSRFRVFNSGGIVANGVYVNGITRSFITSPSDGIVTLYDSGATSFNRLQFGGTTNAFPAIKRNGAELQIRLADDSANAICELKGLRNSAIDFLYFYNDFGFEFKVNSGGNQVLSLYTDRAIFGPSAGNASARLEIQSTTQGFLPPRMTTTQRDLIATPAAGLMIYNTTTNRPNFYDGSAWVAL